MLWIAIRMLTGDAQKFYGLLFGIAFSTLLITQQMTIFVNLVQRGASGVYNAPEAEVWVMDPVSRTTDVSYAMPSTALDKVRSVKGVEWAVPHLRAQANVRTAEGDLEGVAVIGVDDATLIGLPKRMAEGDKSVLFAPDAVAVDDTGALRFFPAGASASTRITKALLAGPSEWLSANGATHTAFPAGTALVADTVPVSRGTATVDLNSAALSADPTVIRQMKQQLSASLQSVDNITAVTMLVDGATLNNAISSTVDSVLPKPVDSRPLVLTDKTFGYWTGTTVDTARPATSTRVQQASTYSFSASCRKPA